MWPIDPTALWTGDGASARVVRTLLAPLRWGFSAGVAARNRLFDAGVFPVHPTAVPAVSIGNLSVGGTGKTPVAADLARRLREAGARPALVLRGYGNDEPAVHALLNPDVPVITNPDRVAGCKEARSRGCDVAVLDDAFQHRRAARVADIVLIAAEQWSPRARVLPTGPYREPLSSLARASLVLVTRKSASTAEAAECASSVARFTSVPVARIALELDELVEVAQSPSNAPDAASAGAGAPAPERRVSLDALRGARVLAIAGIGAPSAFARQLETAGARVDLVSFPDHHRFTNDDMRVLGRRAGGAEFVVCTLKDAVKLADRWPRDLGTLWYVSLRLKLEAGGAAYAACVQRVLDARSGHS
jgi:tetraacyldisaccharide 4'-kinase